MEPDFKFTPGKAPGQWQVLDERFVLRCPRCANRFSLQAFQIIEKDPRISDVWQMKCPHRGCGWRSMVATLEGAHTARVRILTDIFEGYVKGT